MDLWYLWPPYFQTKPRGVVFPDSCYITLTWKLPARPKQSDVTWPKSACLFHSLETSICMCLRDCLRKNVFQKWISKQSNNSIARLPTLIEFDHCYRPSNGRTLLLSLVLLIAIIVWYIYLCHLFCRAFLVSWNLSCDSWVEPTPWVWTSRTKFDPKQNPKE